MKFVGIDISKDVFDVAVLEKKEYSNAQFKNKTEGFTCFMKWLKPTQTKSNFSQSH